MTEFTLSFEGANSDEAEMTKTKALCQSILIYVFSGKLVPQDPNDEPASVLLERIKSEQAKAPKQKKGSSNGKN